MAVGKSPQAAKRLSGMRIARVVVVRFVSFASGGLSISEGLATHSQTSKSVTGGGAAKGETNSSVKSLETLKHFMTQFRLTTRRGTYTAPRSRMRKNGGMNWKKMSFGRRCIVGFVRNVAVQYSGYVAAARWFVVPMGMGVTRSKAAATSFHGVVHQSMWPRTAHCQPARNLVF
jgi:hypothetical protein